MNGHVEVRRQQPGSGSGSRFAQKPAPGRERALRPPHLVSVFAPIKETPA